MDPGDEPFLQVLRPLVEAYRAFLRRSDRHIRSMGLTPAQFDVIATLGDTGGITCKDLCEKTLVTKGTLTGVLDRLTAKGLISRVPSREDRRAVVIRLTPKGDEKFRTTFPQQIHFLKPFFDRALPPHKIKPLRGMLLKIKESFEQGREGGSGRERGAV